MLIQPMAFALLLLTCASHVDVRTQASLNWVEAGGCSRGQCGVNPWVLHDNDSDVCHPITISSGNTITCRRGTHASGAAYFPTSYADAVEAAQWLIGYDARQRGDSGVDVGVSQINSNNFPGLGVNASQMLRPCANLRESAHMLNNAYHEQYAAVSAQPNRYLAGYRDRRGRLTLPADYVLEQVALRRAYSVYNSNRAYGAPAYVARILAGASSGFVMQTTAFADALRTRARLVGTARQASEKRRPK